MKDYSNSVRPPPYEALNIPAGMVSIQTEQSSNPGRETQQPGVTNVNVRLSYGPISRWQYVIAIFWFLLIIGLAVSIFIFCFLPFPHNWPNSGFHYGLNTARQP